MTTLSPYAQKLYNLLLSKGSIHEDNAILELFPTVKYIGTLDPNFSDDEKRAAQIAHWQRDVNLYGNENTRPVLGESILFTPTANYSKAVSAAYQELRKAGLATESNNGYNSYTFYPVKKY